MLHDAREPGAFSVVWDGRNSEGHPFDPGPAKLVVELDCGTGELGTTTADLWIVRLGVVGVDFDGSPDQVPLAYHKTDLATGGFSELDGVTEFLCDRERDTELADLDLDDGTPRPAPTVWADPDSPPWGDGQPGVLGLGQPQRARRLRCGGQPRDHRTLRHDRGLGHRHARSRGR